MAVPGKAEALFAHKLVALGHRLRKTTKGFEMNVITPGEVRTFSKRSEQIRQLEEKLGDELQKRADIALRAAARQGKALDPETAYAAEKAKLAGEYRELKSRAKLEGEELEADWRRQLEPGRLEQITPEIGHVPLQPQQLNARALPHAQRFSVVLKLAQMPREILLGMARALDKRLG